MDVLFQNFPEDSHDLFVGSPVHFQTFSMGEWPLSIAALHNRHWHPANVLVRPHVVFTLKTMRLTSSFRATLMIMQGVYIISTSCGIDRLASISIEFEGCFIAHNFLQVISHVFFSRSKLWIAEMALLLDLVNLFMLYHSYYCDVENIYQPVNPSTKQRVDHISLISGSLPWVLVAIFWNASMILPQGESLAAGFIGNMCIWSILALGFFNGIMYKVGGLTNPTID